MATKSLFKPIDTAFAILFVLLIAVCFLHISETAQASTKYSTNALKITADLERFRSLDSRVSLALDCLRNDSFDPTAKTAILTLELDQIERALSDLGRSGVRVAGLTRLVEPFSQISDTRTLLQSPASDDLASVLARGGQLERALVATRFVVRNNITRLAESQLAEWASVSGFSDRPTSTAVWVMVAAIVAFVPVRFMAVRSAAKPIQMLRDATRALGEERWSPVRVEDASNNDAVSDLLVAFRTMATKLQESRQGRADSFRRTLVSLVQAIEAKDQYVSNHSVNVSKLAEELARAIGMSDADVSEIACGALLHDIGKIGVPDEIMNKPGALTPEEFDIMREHPVIGDRIISPLDGADVLHAPVRHHHENWDGAGYPDGLRGESIPLDARIIKIADVFEALTSDRSYRNKMSVSEAVAIIRSEAGTALDPDLVETFLSKVLPRLPELLPNLTLEQEASSESTTEMDVGEKVLLVEGP